MAQVVLAVGSSHGPTVQSPPEKWAKLGEGDKFDPRFDYDGFLKVAPPGLDKEITPEMMQIRDAAKTVALGKLTQIIKDAKPDVIVVVSNIHRVEKTGHHPIFGIMRAPSFPVARMSERLFDPEARKHKLDDEKDKYHVYNADSERPGHPALATWLVNGLIEDGFDVATHDNFAKGAVLDDAFAFVDKWLFDNVPIPIVPFVISRDLPNQATAARCDDLGKALAQADRGMAGEGARRADRVGRPEPPGGGHRARPAGDQGAGNRRRSDAPQAAARPPEQVARHAGDPQLGDGRRRHGAGPHEARGLSAVLPVARGHRPRHLLRLLEALAVRRPMRHSIR